MKPHHLAIQDISFTQKAFLTTPKSRCKKSCGCSEDANAFIMEEKRLGAHSTIRAHITHSSCLFQDARSGRGNQMSSSCNQVLFPPFYDYTELQSLNQKIKGFLFCSGTQNFLGVCVKKTESKWLWFIYALFTVTRVTQKIEVWKMHI